MSKYESLSQFLVSETSSPRRMSFHEIERVLGFKLPRSAYQHQAWWSNNPTGHSHSLSWIEAGWRTKDVDIEGRKVTFYRESSKAMTSRPSTKRDPWGCMAGTITIMPGVDLTAPTGDQWSAEQGRLLNE